MRTILVSGLVNIETTVPVQRFPIEYQPINYLFNDIESNVSGVGFNISAALKALGTEPYLLSVVGCDMNSEIINMELRDKQIKNELYPVADSAPHSVVLYDDTGARRIYCDLKNVQDTALPADIARHIPSEITFAAVCNSNFSRTLLKPLKEKGVCVATDLHVLSDIYDQYNADFMEAADILFLSNEGITGIEQDFIRRLARAYESRIIVIGMGARGALMYVRSEDNVAYYPARNTREIVNTVGAGDALFACFLHFYSKTGEPHASLENAIIFASWKIGEKGASKGLLSETELLELKARLE